MDETFRENERLYRAVKPEVIYWKENGLLSSAAFKDDGLSVDRQGRRTDIEAAKSFKERGFIGEIVWVTVCDCHEIKAIVCYLPEPDNIYHSEIRRDDTNKKLTNGQAKELSRRAKMVTMSIT